jgi:hypothetical protein
MRVTLTYIRQDGKLRGTAAYDSLQPSFAEVVAEVRANSRQQGKLPGLTGRGDCYHIVVQAARQRALVHATRWGSPETKVA